MYGVHKLLVTFFLFQMSNINLYYCWPICVFFTSKKIYHTDYMEAEDRCFVKKKKTNTRRS